MLTFSTRNFSVPDERYIRASVKAFKDAGLNVKWVKEDGDYIMHLTSRKKMKTLYPEVERASLSVTDRAEKEIHLLKDNWDSIPTHLGSEYKSLDDYRTALISHELAHALGHDHVTCACVGCLSDVRQQPSRELGGCLPTTRVIFNSKSPHTSRNL